MSFRISNTDENFTRALVQESTSTSAEIIYVGVGLSFTTIQSALNVAGERRENLVPGQPVIVIVQSGVYTEDVTVPDGVILAGVSVNGMSDNFYPAVFLTGSVTFEGSGGISNMQINTEVEGIPTVRANNFSTFYISNCYLRNNSPASLEALQITKATGIDAFLQINDTYIICSQSTNSAAGVRFLTTGSLVGTFLNIIMNNLNLRANYGVSFDNKCVALMTNCEIQCPTPVSGPCVAFSALTGEAGEVPGTLKIYRSTIINTSNLAAPFCLDVGAGQTCYLSHCQLDAQPNTTEVINVDTGATLFHGENTYNPGSSTAVGAGTFTELTDTLTVPT